MFILKKILTSLFSNNSRRQMIQNDRSILNKGSFPVEAQIDKNILFLIDYRTE